MLNTIILYGHVDTVQAVYLYVDLLLRERQLRNVALIQTTTIDQTLADRLRKSGGELWYCGPSLTPPGGGWCPVRADKYLLSGAWGTLPGKVFCALVDFMGRARVTA